MLPNLIVGFIASFYEELDGIDIGYSRTERMVFFDDCFSTFSILLSSKMRVMASCINRVVSSRLSLRFFGLVLRACPHGNRCGKPNEKDTPSPFFNVSHDH